MCKGVRFPVTGVTDSYGLPCGLSKPPSQYRLLQPAFLGLPVRGSRVAGQPPAHHGTSCVNTEASEEECGAGLGSLGPRLKGVRV